MKQQKKKQKGLATKIRDIAREGAARRKAAANELTYGRHPDKYGKPVPVLPAPFRAAFRKAAKAEPDPGESGGGPDSEPEPVEAEPVPA